MGRSTRHGFTLVELLVVIALIGLLVGILLPAMAGVRRRAVKVACMSNLRQLGMAIQMYSDRYHQVYPTARYMPEPIVSSDSDPPLTDLLRGDLMAGDGEGAKVYHCPGDSMVFDLTACSYMYQSELSGLRIEEFFPVQHFGVPPSLVVVMRDFDAGVFDIDQGGGVTQINVPPFHDLRNLLFADGHVGNYAQ